ncbi:ribulokinase [Serratia bockelmannii]|uniref:Ribulokinase n=1 Tax=Serratia bockelmannii TaxID=2703793 RepID=A0ABT8LWZ0_9GAMM|nr:ribulokinase [Serratia bockelmannii]MDN6881827.1 ribulokinase [Serratia bockelmannii]HBH6890298.1 ribulokinase [Serratia marcescens]
MSQQNVKGATTKPTAASAQTHGRLTVPQVYDLFCYVQAVCGRTTGTIEPPAVPANAEEVFADFGDFDTISVWLVDGWPVAASDQMTMTHWHVNAGQ